MRETTLCYIEKDDAYLMLHRTKKKQDGSYEKWLGVGGKLEKNESHEACVLREVKEETGYTLTNYTFRAKIYFYSDTWEDEIMYLYTAEDFYGEEVPCDEGELAWIPKKDVLSLKLWEGDKLFLERLLKDDRFFELELRYEGDDLVNYKWLSESNSVKSEIFDVVDENGEPTGEIIERRLAHSKGVRHRTSHIWIIREIGEEYQVLLQKRSLNKDSHPGCYDISSAGHIHAGRDFKESALRELEEEVGISANLEDLIYVDKIRTYRETKPHGNTFIDNQVSAVFIYMCNKAISEFRLQEDEVESVSWISLDECMYNVRNNTFQHCMRIEELEMVSKFLKSQRQP